jgi:adenylate cyclase
VSNEPNSADGEPPALERRLATILSADVAGYTRLMGTNEEATVKTLRAHRAVFEALLKQHHGRVFNTAGDAILAEFPSAVEAVRCATEIQTALQTRNEHLPPELKMLFRMGINLGDVVVQEGDLLGDGVNVAARLQTIAEPGGICISGSVYDQIQNKLSLQFRPLGEQQFKNVGQPVRTFTITHGEAGALPASRRMTSRLRALGIVAVAGAALAAGGIWLYRQSESKSAEQSALSAQLEAEKKATEDARRAAEEQSRRAAEAEGRAERERLVAEAAKREATLQAQLQSAENARLRAETERKRLEEDRQRAEAERRAAEARAEADRRAAEARAEADKRAAEARAEAEKKRLASAAPANVAKAPPPAAAPAVIGGTAKFDGAYTGMMCNFPDDPAKKTCWAVPLKVQNGGAALNWPSRVPGKRTTAQLTIADGGAVKYQVEGWNLNTGAAMQAALSGTASAHGIDLEGRWANGVKLDGHWTRTP